MQIFFVLPLKTLQCLSMAFQWKSKFHKNSTNSNHSPSCSSQYSKTLEILADAKCKIHLLSHLGAFSTLYLANISSSHLSIHSLLSCPHHHPPNAPVQVRCSSYISHRIYLHYQPLCQSAFQLLEGRGCTSQFLSQYFQAAIKKNTVDWVLTQQNLFLIFLESRKSKNMSLTDLVSGEGVLPVSQTAIFSI